MKSEIVVFIFASLFLINIFLTNSCKEKINSENITSVREAEKFVLTFFQFSEKQNVRECYKMLSDNFKVKFKEANAIDYLEAYDDESFKAETHEYNFRIIDSYIVSKNYYFKAEYFIQSSDAPGKSEKKTYTLTLIQNNNGFLIDDIKYSK